MFPDTDKTTDFISVSSSKDDVPPELYTLIRWILLEPEKEVQTKMRSRTVSQSALTISQHVMFAYKSKRQVQYKSRQINSGFRPQHRKENPQVVGLALTVHHDIRNKRMIELLHA